MKRGSVKLYHTGEGESTVCTLGCHIKQILLPETLNLHFCLSLQSSQTEWYSTFVMPTLLGFWYITDSATSVSIKASGYDVRPDATARKLNNLGS